MKNVQLLQAAEDRTAEFADQVQKKMNKSVWRQ
jgi:hypothetical protein